MGLNKRSRETPDEPEVHEGPVPGVDYSPNVPLDVPADKWWERYAVQAANSVYNRLNHGQDYAIGRREPGGALEVLDQREDIETTIDMGKIQEAAQKIAEGDPNYPDYQQPPPLSRNQRVDEPGMHKTKTF